MEDEESVKLRDEEKFLEVFWVFLMNKYEVLTQSNLFKPEFQNYCVNIEISEWVPIPFFQKPSLGSSTDNVKQKFSLFSQ